MLLLRGEPSGEVASHCNPRHKGARKPNSSKDSVSGAQIPASAMVCVGAARNPWTCQDVGIELSRITPIWVVRQGVTDAIPTSLGNTSVRESMPSLLPCTPRQGPGKWKKKATALSNLNNIATVHC